MPAGAPHSKACLKLTGTSYVGSTTLGKQLAVQERKKLCLKRGWVEEKALDLVCDVYYPLPIIVDAVLSDVEDEQEEVVFQTHKTPSYIASHDGPPPFMISPPDTS